MATTLRFPQHRHPELRIDLLRYLLAIAGVLVGTAAVFGLLFLLPGDRVTAQQAPAAEDAIPDAEPETVDGNLRVCNQTRNTISVALGYKAERGWQSEGWWVAEPGDCRTVYNGILDARYYYLYAADDVSGGTWDGNFFLCTRDETFTIFGVEDCLARGYERTGFFEVDTQNRSNWTVQLTEGDVLPPQSVDGFEDAEPLEGELDPASGPEQPAADDTPDAEGAAGE